MAFPAVTAVTAVTTADPTVLILTAGHVIGEHTVGFRFPFTAGGVTMDTGLASQVKHGGK